MSKNKDAQAPAGVLEYLTRTNRPYSSIDIFNNMHKEYGKTAVVKACELLTEQNKIKEKVYGKQKVYVADQSNFADVAESELTGMRTTIAELTGQVNGYQSEIKHMEAELKTLNSALTTSEAISQLAAINSERTQFTERLAKLKGGSNSVSPAQKDRIYSCRNKYVKEWRKRKRMATDILGSILEGYPKTKKQLYEDIGLETDEDYNVKCPAD